MQERKHSGSKGEATDRNRCKMQKLQSVRHTLKVIDNRGIWKRAKCKKTAKQIVNSI